MRCIRVIVQIIFILAIPLTGDTETICLDKIKTLELKRNHAVSIGGMWGYFEKNFNLNKIPTEAIQLDSRINKIFFLLSHLCETQNGVPLTPLAIYVSKNISKKGKEKFKDELLTLGKTPQQIKEWFEYSNYSKKNISRTLNDSKIQNAIHQSTPLIMRYVQLTEVIPNENVPKGSSQKTRTLVNDIDHLLSNQPYLIQALEETSHFLYWDISEGDLG